MCLFHLAVWHSGSAPVDRRAHNITDKTVCLQLDSASELQNIAITIASIACYVFRVLHLIQRYCLDSSWEED